MQGREKEQEEQLAQEVKRLQLRLKEIQAEGFLYTEVDLIIQDRLEYAESIIATVREPLIVLDRELKVVTASKAFYDTFKSKPEETISRFIYDLGNRQWDIPELRKLLDEVLPRHKAVTNFQVEHDFLDIGRRFMFLNAEWIPREAPRPQLILLAIEDVTKLKKLEEDLRNTYAELDTRVNVRTTELSKANEDLHKEISQRRQIEEELKARMQDLERFSKFAVDRELKMEELEKKIKEFEVRLNRK